MSSLQFGVPSASTSSNRRPIILPPPRDIAGLQHRSNSSNNRHHHSQIRPSDHRSITATSTPRHQPLHSSLSSRPAYSSSSSRNRASNPSFIPTQSAASFSHWATQDPFDSVPRPRRSVLTSSWAFSASRPFERRPRPPLPFAPSPPASQARARQAPRQRSGSYSTSAASSPSSVSDSDPEPTTTMPAPRQTTRKRRATNEIPSSSPSESPAASTRSNKRRATQRASTSSADKPEASSWRTAAPRRAAPLRRTNTKNEPVEDPIVFESSDIEEESTYKVIDLVDKDEVPEDVATPEPKGENMVKLGTFQCVICMDDVTDLTVTHCGHLFCSECLHSSLHIDVSKKVCPICRQKVETNPAAGKFTSKSKGFWPLELKLMTTKRSGKRAAR